MNAPPATQKADDDQKGEEPDVFHVGKIATGTSDSSPGENPGSHTRERENVRGQETNSRIHAGFLATYTTPPTPIVALACCGDAYIAEYSVERAMLVALRRLEGQSPDGVRTSSPCPQPRRSLQWIHQGEASEEAELVGRVAPGHAAPCRVTGEELI